MSLVGRRSARAGGRPGGYPPRMESRPLVLFAPGAGAPSTSEWMRRWAARLEAVGEVVPFDYPYMAAGRKSPDRLPVLKEAHRGALERALGVHADPDAGAPARTRTQTPRPVILAGKSMGSRIGCHVAADEPGLARALVCLGYPLRSPRGELRDAVLLALSTPILFVQGTRDPLCPLAALEEVRKRMTAPSALHVVEGGNHSLEVGLRALRAAGRTQEEVDAEVTHAIAAFVARHAG